MIFATLITKRKPVEFRVYKAYQKSVRKRHPKKWANDMVYILMEEEITAIETYENVKINLYISLNEYN